MLCHFGIKARLDCQIESAGIGVPNFSAQPLKPRFNPKITSAWMKFYHLESLKIFFFFDIYRNIMPSCKVDLTKNYVIMARQMIC